MAPTTAPRHDPLTVLPHNLYGLSKRWGEEACELYTDRPFVFRFSMPYGPGAPPGRGRRALDTMLWQAFHGLPIVVHAGAERSWCWIDDLIAGVVRVIEHGDGGAWNVGRDDDPVPMLDLARKCCALTGQDPDELITVVPAPSAQTVVKRLSTAKLRSLGWEPSVGLDEGLERMLGVGVDVRPGRQAGHAGVEGAGSLMLTSRIPQIIGELEVGTATSVHEGAQAVERNAKALVPSVTGKLRDAIHVEEHDDGTYVVAGDTEAWYGHFVEYGTVRQSPHPFLVPALEASRAEIVGSVALVLRSL